jgi:RNA polymerase sigma factor (TIGR02999 family)
VPNLPSNSRSDVTGLLRRWSGGDESAAESLWPLIYNELRRLAGSLMKGERAEHTLQPTELVHEAFLRLSGGDTLSIEDRRHFFLLASRAMRRILVDHARRKLRRKRTPAPEEMKLAFFEDSMEAPAAAEVISVHNALDQLAFERPRHAQLVELRYFGGFTLDEAADVLEVSRATAARDWRLARALLLEALASPP